MVTDPFFSPERRLEEQRKRWISTMNRAMFLDGKDDKTEAEERELDELTSRLAPECDR